MGILGKSGGHAVLTFFTQGNLVEGRVDAHSMTVQEISILVNHRHLNPVPIYFQWQGSLDIESRPPQTSSAAHWSGHLLSVAGFLGYRQQTSSDQ